MTDPVSELHSAVVDAASAVRGDGQVPAPILERPPKAEFGFQTNPPDGNFGLSLGRHAAALNEAERLYFGDPKVKSIAQFELYDVPALVREDPDQDTYTTGLRFIDGTPKPSLTAFQMPLVVTRLAPGEVEVWGMARPAEGRTRVTVTRSAGPKRPFRAVRTVRTNPTGYFRIRMRGRSVTRMRYRLEWRSPDGALMLSRQARAGRRLRYLEPVDLPVSKGKLKEKTKAK